MSFTREIHAAHNTEATRTNSSQATGLFSKSIKSKETRIIKQACEVAGISYGTDLKINNPPIIPRSRATRGTGA